MILLGKKIFISPFTWWRNSYDISRVNVTHSRIGSHKSNQPRIRSQSATCEFWLGERECICRRVVKLIFILAGIQDSGSCASFSADNAARGVIISFRKPQTPARLFRPVFSPAPLFNRGLKASVVCMSTGKLTRSSKIRNILNGRTSIDYFCRLTYGV